MELGSVEVGKRPDPISAMLCVFMRFPLVGLQLSDFDVSSSAVLPTLSMGKELMRSLPHLHGKININLHHLIICNSGMQFLSLDVHKEVCVIYNV